MDIGAVWRGDCRAGGAGRGRVFHAVAAEPGPGGSAKTEQGIDGGAGPSQLAAGRIEGTCGSDGTESGHDAGQSRAESIRKEQKASDDKLSAQLGEVQKASDEKIGAVATEVGGAKKDIEATKTDLEATKGKLERSLGDMNVMSGLIAHNRDDLEELRRRGDRNYYEFTLQRSKSAQRVGPVQMALNRTDPKKAKYTLTVVADDKTIEKKDKTSGEPVQFYVKGSARLAPYEIVVFDVGKNQITGYLATPKEGGAAPPPAAAAPAAATPTAAPAKP